MRLAVEGGGQVKAELVTVGQSGEQSLKRIETAGGKASGGLKDLGRQAELLRTGIRTLGGALAGVTTVGGLAALVNRSISAADAIGKTADKIGVGVEALQELRFAAKASGVEQQTLDMALQRFTRRTAEAAQGTGEAKDALAQLGITLRDQDGHLRRSEDMLADVADAFARIEDPAERVRLAFKLFDSEGVALVNLLSDGSGALDQMRERSRDLGIVLDEHLVRDAERAWTELDTATASRSSNARRVRMLSLAASIRIAISTRSSGDSGDSSSLSTAAAASMSSRKAARAARPSPRASASRISWWQRLAVRQLPLACRRSK